MEIGRLLSNETEEFVVKDFPWISVQPRPKLIENEIKMEKTEKGPLPSILHPDIFENAQLDFLKEKPIVFPKQEAPMDLNSNYCFVSRAQFPFKLFSLKKGRFQTRAREAKKTVAKVRQIDEFDALCLGIDQHSIPHTFCLIDLNPTRETPLHEVRLQKEIYPERQDPGKIAVFSFQPPSKVERFLAIRTGNLEAEKPTIVYWNVKTNFILPKDQPDYLAKLYKPQLFRITVKNFAIHYKQKTFEENLEPLQIPVKDYYFNPSLVKIVFQISFQTRSQQSKENKLGGTGENGYMLVVRMVHAVDNNGSFFLEPVKLSRNVSDDEEPKLKKKKRNVLHVTQDNHEDTQDRKSVV